jgi:hypothetical protein
MGLFVFDEVGFEGENLGAQVADVALLHVHAHHQGRIGPVTYKIKVNYKK